MQMPAPKPPKARQGIATRTSPPATEISQSYTEVQASIEFFKNAGPSAAEARAFEELTEGGADRLLRLRELEIDLVRTQVLHRHSLERDAVENEISSSKRGQYSGNIWIGVAFATELILSFGGHQTVAIALAPYIFAPIVAAFLIAQGTRTWERVTKTKILAQEQSKQEAKRTAAK